ncbi:MAG: ABC transporter substrate-binding protein [Syntrophomonas sp.]|nr:ABC transporter substrate-binding protein [Syntrophomonas sp.]
MKKKLTRVLAIALAIMMMAVFATGCQKTTTTTSNKSTKTVAETRTVVDFTGAEVKIPKVVNRICSTYPAVEEMFLLLGSPGKNIAVNTSNVNNKWYIKFYPEITKLPMFISATSEINVEMLMSLKPDVVIVSTKEQKSTVENAGIPAVMMMGTSPETLIKCVNLLGEIMGEKETKIAAQLSAFYQKNIDNVTAKTTAIAKADRPTVFYAANGILNTEGNGTIVKSWIEMAGGVNIAAENGIEGTFKDVSPEQLLQWNPDIIICRDYAHKKAYLADARLAKLSAIKNDKVYVNPRGVFPWCVRSADEALQVLWAATVIQPKLFADIDMKAEVTNFYNTYYKYTPTEKEIQDILFPTAP